MPPTANGEPAVEELADEEDSDQELAVALGSDDDGSDPEAPAALSKKPALRSRNLRQSVWFDPADEQLQISLLGQKRTRKLRDDEDEDVVSGLEYENRLRRQ